MANAVPQQQDLKRFEGLFLVWKLNAHGFRMRVNGVALPRKRHATIEEAEAEARRLNLQFPASTFVVIQEVARVKMVDAVALDVAA